MEEENYKINLKGKKTWTVNFGFGDGESLSNVGYPKGSYSLSQSLKVNLDGRLGEVFSLGANLDDTKPGYLQEFSLKMDTENWDGKLGNLTTEEGKNFTVYNKKLLGLRLNGDLGGARVEALAGTLQGVSKTKVFHGDSAESKVEFSLYKSEAGLEESVYRKNIRGLQYYPLDVEYVEGFTVPELQFRLDEGLWKFLNEWGIDYLRNQIEDRASKQLSSGQFDVVSEDKDYLVLLRDRASLIRGRIKEYISGFNEDLPEEEQREYPFNPGTDYEREFLQGLEEYLRLTVGEKKLRLDRYERRRFYFIGRTGVKREGFQLEIKRDGDWESIGDLSSYNYTLFPEKGLIDLNFPEKFFKNLGEKRIKASFQYEISGKTYMLGFSVTPESEKVYLNGQLLKRNTDYSIDYETGMLLIFNQIGPDDKIRVDFERARGGLGGFAQYGRNLYGFSTRMKSDYGLVLDVSLFQARDSAPEDLPADVSTMPNVHTVAGIQAQYKKNGWNTNLKFGGNVNRFPFDDNQRINLPNQINEIIPLSPQGYEVILFLHNNGFTARRTDGWESYDRSDGLAGNTVNAGVVVENSLYLGTDTGLTTVNLSGVSPFGRSGNWNSYFEGDGLPDQEIWSLTSDGETIWAGTSSGVIRAQVGSLDEKAAWKKITSDYFDDIPVRSIAYLDDYLWLGTDKGLYLFDLSRGEIGDKTPKLEGRILDLQVKGGNLLVATEDGITKISPDMAKEQVIEGEMVNALSVNGDKVWFGTGDGFYQVGSSVRYGKGVITAVQATDSGVWAGSEGEKSGDTRELVLYKLTDSLNRYSTDQTKIKGSDEDRFRNIDPDLHTDGGIYLSGKIGKSFDVWSKSSTVTTRFEYVQPTYTPIGRRKRNDKLSTSVNLDVEVTETLSLGLGSDYSVSSLSTGSGTWAITNRISAYWNTLVNTTAKFTWKTGEEGKTNLGLNLGLEKSFWGDILTTALNIKGNREISSDGFTTNYVTLSSKVSVSLRDSVSLGLNYTLPLLIGSLEKGEEEKLNWNFDFSRNIPFTQNYGAALRLNGKGSLDSPLTEGVRSFDSKAKTNLELDKLKLAGVAFSPSLSLSWKTDGASNELTGKASVKGSTEKLSTGTTLSRTAKFSARSKLVTFKDKFQGNVKYDLAGLTPELNYSIGRDLLTHPDFGKKSTYKGNLTLGVKWQLIPDVSNRVDVGVKYRPDRGLSYTFDDLLSWKITSKLAPELDLGLDYFPDSGELDISTKAELSYPFRKRWGISFLSGVNWELDEYGEVYTSYYGAVGLKVEF